MRSFAILALLVLPGCFSPPWCDPSAGPCSAPVAPDPCEGECKPFIGGGWEPVLVAEAPGAHCPTEVAPFEAMSSAAPPVTACGLQEEDGDCAAPGFVCLPAAPAPWAVCVVQNGAHECPSPYSDPVEVDSDVTLCCLAPPGEPE